MLTLVACTTTENISPPAIKVAQSLSKQDTEYAILFALTNAPTAKLSPKKIQILNAAVNEYGSQKQYWFYDGQGKDVINASFKYRSYYMRVKISYKDKNINLKIVNSRNLKQKNDPINGGRIHKKALVYLGGLDRNIRSTLAGFERINYQQKSNKKIK